MQSFESKRLPLQEQSDAELVQGFIDGDQDCFTQIQKKYDRRLHAFIRTRIHNPSDVDDVLQEAWMGFVKSAPNFQAGKDLFNYLCAIASFKSIDYLRKQGRRKAIAPDEGTHDIAVNSVETWRDTEAGSTVEEEIFSKEAANADQIILGEALTTLAAKNERHATALIMRLGGSSIAEIAEVLDLTNVQTSNQIFAAKTSLISILESTGTGEKPYISQNSYQVILASNPAITTEDAESEEPSLSKAQQVWPGLAF